MTNPLLSLLSGEKPSTRPTLDWGVRTETADGHVVSELPSDLSRGPYLVEVPNPFGLAIERGIALNDEIQLSPEKGKALYESLLDDTRASIDKGLSQGADGFLYHLFGATEALCTPMEYGGHHLEVDRELLASYSEQCIRLVFVAGGAGTYLDFVSDLPADAFGWDVTATGVSASEIRKFRSGPLFAADPDADIDLLCVRQARVADKVGTNV